MAGEDSLPTPGETIASKTLIEASIFDLMEEIAKRFPCHLVVVRDERGATITHHNPDNKAGLAQQAKEALKW